MTIGEYEMLRNRLEEILRSGSKVNMKMKKLRQLMNDLLNGFSEEDNHAHDLIQEVLHELDMLADG